MACPEMLKNLEFWQERAGFSSKTWKNSLVSSKKKFLKLFRYRGEDVVKMRSENGEIENFQGFTRFVAKSLKIWPIFLKKSTGNLEFWQKKVIFSSKFRKRFCSSGEKVAQKRCKTGKKGF